MATDLIDRAQAGDGQAFRQLVEPYQRELQVHCYRILGSAQDAEDAVQETLLAAWRGLGGFEQRSSLRTWLYRIATTRSLNALRSASRRPAMDWSNPDLEPPEPTRLGEVSWLEPYPDLLLEGLPDQEPGPQARYEAREAISLAFVTALQILPPRQRAALILRDVLGFTTGEAAQILQASEQSVASAVKRARATLARQLPLPLEFEGRELAARFLTLAFRGRRHQFRLIPTRANGQPAFGVYVRDPHAPVLHANGLLVLTLTGDRISMITRFDTSVLPSFGLPRSLPG